MGFDNARLVEKGERIEIEDDGRYNSAFLVRGGRVELRYDKMALTPFGEVMPGFRYWPWLQKKVLGLAANGMSFDLAEGKGPRAFSVEPVPVSIVTPICFEITKPGVCRKLALASDHRPIILLNLTNDGWFGGFDPAREQHLQIARWRAAELGVSVVRAANTGISAVIDPTGRVLARGVDGSPKAAQVDGTLTLDVAASAPGTIYSRTGDVLGWSTLAGTVLALVLAKVRGYRGVEMAA
jgi:apolipoprotein N-acyltransferase